MNRQKQLVFCKVCKNQKFDMKQGVICELTNTVADFQETCEHYEEDVTLKEKEKVQELERALNHKEASQGQRFANLIIDYIFIIIFSFVAGILLALFSPETMYALEQENPILNYVFGFVIGVTYYTFFEMTTSRTMGKIITGTKVVDEQGNVPEAGTILLRSLCRYIPFDAFSFLGEGTGWHDTLSKTKVVNK
ncbi:RDD family protein [Aquimarina aggregata]|uniref:RDD family protein n=1 Tax=Aquimarina aggregata TaxID=1642818 RepID=UPI0009ECCF4B|nr:RDD family protein [Aquimarina aggregata]